MDETFWAAEGAALLQVLLIDVALAGDNAVVVGMAAAGVEESRRARVILWGIGAAVVIRIALALVAVELLDIIGLTLAGGLLLLYVAYRMFRQIRAGGVDTKAVEREAKAAGHKSFRTAFLQIVAADVSMSLDNVLAVAGAARDHPSVLVVGLLISVVLMGVAASLIARLLQRFRFVAWLGLLVILFVALEMIWGGYNEVADAVPALPALEMPGQTDP
ncbi:membrane protein [Aureimonas endophytica]|uniref:Membrane protein n=1 Tax=Aureimonas endophytica TaxID=2027858 RepID=A0A917E7X7_9HYPH|nr:YjbE family putative metal transport protein [Aureimonas endophytica]GGE13776.1 membrane protein [Aureimonas endophytica]